MTELATRLGVTKQALGRFSVELKQMANGRFVHSTMQPHHNRDSIVAQTQRRRQELEAEDPPVKIYDENWPMRVPKKRRDETNKSPEPKQVCLPTITDKPNRFRYTLT